MYRDLKTARLILQREILEGARREREIDVGVEIDVCCGKLKKEIDMRLV